MPRNKNRRATDRYTAITVIGTLAVDGWAVTIGTVRRGLQPELGRRWGCWLVIECRCMSRTSHTRVHLGRASPSGMTCLVQCVQRNQISLRNRQLASINTLYIFLYIYLQLYINFPKTLTHTHKHTHISSPLSSLSNHSLTPINIQHVRACSSRCAAYQASLTIRRLADPLSIIFLVPAQSFPRCTKCNSRPINGQCTNFMPLHSKG